MRRLLTLAMLLGIAHSAAAAADPAMSGRWLTHAQGLYARRDFEGAIKAFSNAARADASNAEAWKGLGLCFNEKGDSASALKYFQHALKLNPADPGLEAQIARLGPLQAQGNAREQAARAAQEKRYEDAITLYRQALETDLNNASAWQSLGNCYYAVKNKEKAVEAYRRALSLRPENTALQNFLDAYAPPSPSADTFSGAPGGRDWVQPLWRSALLPGWGQMHNGEGVKGGILMGADILLLAGTAATYVLGSSSRDKYNSLGPSASQQQFDAEYSSWETMANLNHGANILWGVVYAYNLIDAVVSARPAGSGQALLGGDGARLALVPLGGGPGLSWTAARF